MARVERICPALGLTSIPACDLMDIGSIHGVGSFDQYYAPTQWIYAKGTDRQAYRHTTPASSMIQERIVGDIGPVLSATSSSATTQMSRGLSRSHPLYLGLAITAARKVKSFPHYNDLMQCILPSGREEAAALSASPQWVA